jgi:hypothetical protein
LGRKTTGQTHSCGSGSSISSESIWIQGFDLWPKIKEKKYEIFKNILDQKLQFTIKDVQNTGEAFSPQKRTSSTSKNEIY